MKTLPVRLKESFSLSHLTTFSTNIKIHTRAHTQLTEVVYTERTSLSDVWMTANPLNNTENAISVPFLAMVEIKEHTDTRGRKVRKIKRSV